MSSRLLPPGADAEPITWAVASDSWPEPPRPGAPAPARTPPADAPQTAAGQQEVKAREQAAFQRGFAEGQASGQKQAGSQLDPVLARLARTIADLAAARSQAVAQADRDIVQLSIAIGRRILRRELTVDPDSLAGIVRAALDRLELRETHRVRVHAADAASVGRYLQEAGVPPRVEVIPDSSLERGSVIFETARGSLDASVSTQLAEIERGLTDILGRRAS